MARLEGREKERSGEEGMQKSDSSTIGKKNLAK
jgi:hypothetical protein